METILSTAILRIPTKQFAYIEKEVAYVNNEDLKRQHDELYALMNSEQKVSETEFTNRLVDVINSDLTKWGSVDAYNDLNSSQQAVYQALKRFVKRLPRD